MELKKVSNFEINDIGMELDGMQFASHIPKITPVAVYSYTATDFLKLSFVGSILVAIGAFGVSIAGIIDYFRLKKQMDNDEKRISRSLVMCKIFFMIALPLINWIYLSIAEKSADIWRFSEKLLFVNLGFFVVFCVLVVVSFILLLKNKKKMNTTEENSQKTILTCKRHKIVGLNIISIWMTIFSALAVYFIAKNLHWF